MIPPAIRDRAIAAGLRLIAVTDHNSSENVSAVQTACEPDICVLGGMEITSAEEIHLIAICPDRDALAELQRSVYDHLPGRNDPERFGDQYIVDEDGYIVETNDHLLAGATDLDLDGVIRLVRSHDGVVIASHVDRMSFSIVSQLGFIPPGLDIDAVELSKLAGPEHYLEGSYSYPIVMGSDAHEPDQIGSASIVVSGVSPTYADISSALSSTGEYPNHRSVTVVRN